MASQIDPDPVRKPARPAEPAARAARPPASAPRKPEPAGSVAPPAPGKRATTVPPPPQPASERSADEEHDDEEVRPASRGFLTAMPAWAISMLVHVVALLAMALIVGDTSTVKTPRVITSRAVDRDEEFSEFDDQEIPEELPEEFVDPVADVMITAEVAVEPVEVE